MGVLLLVITIIGSSIAINHALKIFVDAVSNQTEEWYEIGENLDSNNSQTILIPGILIGDLVTQGLIVKIGGLIFGACVLILVVLSIMLILQGLCHQSKKQK